MPIQEETTAYGAPAYDRLRGVVAAAKRDDPLAPVTLLVPTNLCGTIARRALAGGFAGDGRRGVAGLTVMTVDRLAELLAAPKLTAQGRRPTTGPVLAAAWRRALAADPGPFVDVADHPATVTALVQSHRTLRDLSAEALHAVADSDPLTGEVVRLHRSVVASLQHRWYDAADLRAAARELLPTATAAAGLGTVVAFLPQDLDRSAAALVAALADTIPVHVIAGVTGIPRADAGVLRSVQRIANEQPRTPDMRSTNAHRVCHASDADDEVRGVVRDVVAACRTTKAHRIAVLYGNASPYARLLHEHLAAAGITVNGPGVRPTTERVLPRALLELLALADSQRLDRAAVFRLLSGAPIRDTDGAYVPASRWERISRIAGVVGGDDWARRLSRYAAEERRAADAEANEEAPRQGLIERHRRDADAADALRAFVADLRTRLDAGAEARSWATVASWALDAYHALLGTEENHRRLPEEEQRAAERVERILAGLRGLDAVETTADLAALREVVELELADDLPRTGRIGTGVLVAPLSAAVGLDADEVYVVGLAEGLCPGRILEDALLPDHARTAAGDELPAVRERIDRQHRQLLAAFAAAPKVTATFPRGDLRRSSERLPSRWLLPTMRALSGVPDLAATRWRDHPGAWLAGSPSYAATVTTTPVPATEQEWRLRTIAARQGDALRSDVALDRAIALQQARRSNDFTRYDGNLAAHAGELPDPADGMRIVSPTALESWVSCPHRYFLQRTLRIEPVEQPEELLTISPAERGSLLHEALDQFFHELRDASTVPGPDDTWTSTQQQRLREIGEQVADEYEERGVSGHPTIWQRERMLLVDDLVRVLDADAKVRSSERRRQVRSELEFGKGDNRTPVVVALPNGRAVRFRGSADRVDECADGTLVVTDYKSGKADNYKRLSETNPDEKGSRLQLPVYGYAALQLLGRADGPVCMEYWFIGPRDRGKRFGYGLTPAVEERYAEVLATIVDGIAGGLFPANAPEDQPWSSFVACAYCDPDGLGAKDRRLQWQRKRDADVLAPYLALVDPEAAVATVTS